MRHRYEAAIREHEERVQAIELSLQGAHAQTSQTKEELAAQHRAEVEALEAKHRASREEHEKTYAEVVAGLKNEAKEHAERAKAVEEALAEAHKKHRETKEEFEEKHRAEIEAHTKALSEQVSHCASPDSFFLFLES